MFNKLNAGYVKCVAIFLVMLVLTLPFYSANAYASLRVTRNSGQDNIDGFVDAQGDEWKLEVEATIPGETITASKLTMNGYPFQSCAQNPGGVYGCSYVVDFRNRVIPEATVPLEIKLFKQDGTLSDRDATKSITFDGSAPQITELDVSQNGQDVEVTFKIKERPDNCVGIGKIEFFEDSSSLRVLEGSALDAKISQKCGENDISERMPLSASTATRTIKIVATDKLGHARTLSRNLFFDGEAPVINASSFKAGNFGRFVPGEVVDVQLSIQAKEERTTLIGRAKSTAFDKEAACAKTDAANNIFTCVWDVRADLSSLTTEITVKDGAGRADTETFASTFTVDSTAPVVDYFGTAAQHSGVNYAGGNTTIVARFTESGSGVSAGKVAADLRGLSATFGSRKYADECIVAQGKWECHWRNLNVVRPGRIFLVEAADTVGNAAELLGADIELDRLAPDIVEESLVVNAVGGEEGYYQSGNWLNVTFDVVESNGLFAVTLDESGIVDRGGVGDVSCVLKESSSDIYACAYITDRIKSGYVSNAFFTIRAEDTAGNWKEVDKVIEIQGQDQETQPHFWRLKEVKCSPDGLDINAMKLVNQRVFCTMEFETDAAVTLLSSRLARCDGDTDKLQDKFMVGNFGGNKKPGLVLEFKVLSEEDIASILSGGASAPTSSGGAASSSSSGGASSGGGSDSGDDGTEDDAVALDYECTFRLLTKRGNQVIQQLEEEKVIISVGLFETQFDRELSTIEDKIEDAKDKAENGLWKLVGTLNEILRWVKAICAMLPVLEALFIVYDKIDEGLDSLREVIITAPIAISYCNGATATEYGNKKIIDYLQVICKVASCNPSYTSDDWYTTWQRRVLDTYNQWTLRSAFEKPGTVGSPVKATSLTDNLVLSVAGLCLPGIVLNLEKYRQIQCRYIGCLENDVKTGVATVESCRELKDYQECKYIWGEVFQVIPFAGAVDQLLGVLKSILTDPVGVIELVIVQLCGAAWCEISGSGRGWCNFFGVLVWLIDLVESVISGFNQIKTTTKADYCSQVL